MFVRHCVWLSGHQSWPNLILRILCNSYYPYIIVSDCQGINLLCLLVRASIFLIWYSGFSVPQIVHTSLCLIVKISILTSICVLFTTPHFWLVIFNLDTDGYYLDIWILMDYLKQVHTLVSNSVKCLQNFGFISQNSSCNFYKFFILEKILR